MKWRYYVSVCMMTRPVAYPRWVPHKTQNFLNWMEFLEKLAKSYVGTPGGFAPSPTGNPESAPVYLPQSSNTMHCAWSIKYVQIFLCWVSIVDSSRSHLPGLHRVRPAERERNGGVYGGRKGGIYQKSSGRSPAEPYGDVLPTKWLHTHSNQRQNIYRYVFTNRDQY